QHDVRGIGVEAVDGQLTIAYRNDFDILVGECELDDALDGDAVVCQKELMRHDPRCRALSSALSAARGLGLNGRLLADKIDDFLHGGARSKHTGDAERLERG